MASDGSCGVWPSDVQRGHGRCHWRCGDSERRRPEVCGGGQGCAFAGFWWLADLEAEDGMRVWPVMGVVACGLPMCSVDMVGVIGGAATVSGGARRCVAAARAAHL